MVQIGYLSFVLALLCVVYIIVKSVFELKNYATPWKVSTTQGLYAITGFLTLAIGILLYLLLQRDFQTLYVANYTSRALSTVYVISALWAGQEGSLLLWGWLLAVCGLVFILQYRKKTEGELAYEHIILAITIGFFLILLIFIANPFEQLSFVPEDGKGMNPLLQNLYMAIHPPILFVGYAGFAIPFVLAFAALFAGKIDDEWLKSVRSWTLFSWYFLGMGIMLGAHWAYLELGWGGYWGWDPVENASLIPWLTSTALIHTLILQRTRGMLKIWNLILSILTFSLCILATFITRSGVIDSVHAFGESVIGYYFLTFLLIIFLSATGLILYRWKQLKEIYDLQSLLSKEGNILLTNHLFMGLGVAVLYGTLYPFFSELFSKQKVVVETVFYNRVSIPVGLAILALLGICQLIAWRKASWENLRKRFLLPFQIALVGLVILSVLGLRHIPTLITCGLGIFVCATIFSDIWKTITRRRTPSPQAQQKTFFTIMSAQRQHYAGYIFHIGVVLMFAGIAVSAAYQREKEVKLAPGESATLGDITFQYEDLNAQDNEQGGMVSAEVSIHKKEKHIATVVPQKRFYGEPPDWQVTTEIGLHTSLLSDIYVILQGWQDDKTALFTFIINPLILWIWVGGFLMFTIGIIFEILPRS